MYVRAASRVLSTKIVLCPHTTQQARTVKKRRRIVIHDTSSSDEDISVKKIDVSTFEQRVLPAVDSNDEHVSVETPQETQSVVAEEVFPTVHYQGVFTHKHSKNCTCVRCAQRCKYVQIQSKHVGSDSSGTTCSSGSEIDDFVCSQEEAFSAKELDELELMFPISAKRLAFFKERK
jgi:hypothetical protein